MRERVDTIHPPGAMRFTMDYWPGIADGSVTVAFRRWKRPTVVAGRPYRTGGGRVEVVDVSVVDPNDISLDDVDRTGHPSADDIRNQLRGDSDWPVYRVEFRRLTEPDPREVLANAADLTADDRADIDRRLARLDAASTHGSWTRETLELIAGHPQTRAPDLAMMVGRETQPFKLDVRKLKNLGLTFSYNPGYRLSPRGAAYLGVPYDPGPERV